MKAPRYLLLLALVIGMTSCDLLEENPKGLIASELFFQTEADAVAAVNAVYDPLNTGWGMYFRGIYLMAELPTDNAEPGQGVNNPRIHALDKYTMSSVNDRIDALYRASYELISRANLAINRVPGVEMNETLKNRLVGEARFLRGLAYFNLVRFFGGVPLMLEPVTSLDPEKLNLPRATADEVYAQIIQDLQAAETSLPASYPPSEAGRATAGAATGLLAKVYLTRQDWANAAQKAQQVIGSGQYDLLPAYDEVFSQANEHNREIIFDVQFMSNTRNGFGYVLMMPRGVFPGVNGNGADMPTPEFYESFAEGDLRRDKTFFTSYEYKGKTYTFIPHWFKFMDPDMMARAGDSNTNYPILRYPDMLLTYAEALNEANGPTAEAYEMVNMVRRRAFGQDINSPSAYDLPAGLTQQAFREAVLDERRWEFGGESHRWFDLVRTGKLLETMRAKGYPGIQDIHTRFPLPQREIDVNPNLQQNAGY